MNFVEYIKSEISRIKEENNDDQFLGICLGENVFKFHNDCDVEYFDDFFIVIDDAVKLAIPYSQVIYVHPVDWDDVKLGIDEMFEHIFKRLSNEDEDNEDD